MNTHFGERKERNMQDRERRMATEGIGRLMISMAVPSVIAQVINILYSVVDRIYIGHIQGVGMEALTGVPAERPLRPYGLERVTGSGRKRSWATALPC